jgi:T5SS/PEP-CTERM-associated repeat protein
MGVLTVGGNAGGAGTLLVQSGGSVSASGLINIGENAGSTGVGTVTGAGSQLTTPATLFVGTFGGPGGGSLTVANGGTVSSAFGAIGSLPGASSAVNVTGAGSAWMVSSSLMWLNGYTGQVTVANGGSVSVGANTYFQTGSSGSLTVDGGTLTTGGLLSESGATASVALSDPAGGPALVVGTDNSSNTYRGSVVDAASGPGSVAKVGTGTLTLTGHLSNTGGYTATGGTIDFSGAVVQPGSGSLTAAAGKTIKYDTGTRVFGGFLRGPGTHVVNGATLSGTTAFNSAVINVIGAGSFVNFTNGGAMTVSAGAGTPTTFSGFTNQASGSITVAAGSKVNAADFESYGTLTLAPNTAAARTAFVNAGPSPLVFGGGSRTFIGTPATASNPAASVDLNGQNAVVAGGLFVNNGVVYDNSNGSFSGPGRLVADFGAVIKGAGSYVNTPVTQNGGRFQAGNSPGRAAHGSLTLGPGGLTNDTFQINNAAGMGGPTPGATGLVSGWTQHDVVTQIGPISTPGTFAWTADALTKETVTLQTLLDPTPVGSDNFGPASNFYPGQSYAWPFVRWTGAYSGPSTDAALDAASVFDATGFQNPTNGGSFGWHLDQPGQTLYLTFTPVPEPGALALVGAAAAAWWAHRRQVRRRLERTPD